MCFRRILLSYVPEEDNLILETLTTLPNTTRKQHLRRRRFPVSLGRLACGLFQPTRSMHSINSETKTVFNFQKRISS